MEPYRYQHFRLALMQEDISFRRRPGPGDPMPRFEMETTERAFVRSDDYAGRKWFVTFASVT